MPKRTQEQIDHCNHMIDVISHWRDGGDVECVSKSGHSMWTDPLGGSPNWNFAFNTYRKALTPITIDNWDLLPEWVQWVARDGNGKVWCYAGKPRCGVDTDWVNVTCERAVLITDFPFVHAGTVDWKDSLIERPKPEIDLVNVK